jgi:chromosome partitioning protein
VKVISFASEKGGCGKTTCVVNLGAALVRRHQKILLIDMDPQGSLTHHLSSECEKIPGNIVDVLDGRVPIASVITQCDSKLHFVASASKLSEYVYEDFRETLANNLNTLKDKYDYIFLDFPPMRTGFTVVLLSLSHQAIVPIEARGGLSIRGLNSQIETIEYVQEKLNSLFILTGVIGCRIVKRMRLCQDVLDYLHKKHKDIIYSTTIRESIKFAEASSLGKTIFGHSAGSVATKDFVALAKEFLTKQKKIGR